MLVLTRRTDQTVVIDGRIVVKVLSIQGHQVQLGFTADKSVPIHRGEVQAEIEREQGDERKIG